MADIIRNALLTLALAQMTIVELPRLLTDDGFRSKVLNLIDDAAVLEYWGLRFDPLSPAARLNMIEPVLNKWGELLADPRVCWMLGQREHCLDIRRIMDRNGWLLVNCSKGRLRDAAHLVGSLFVAQIQSAAMSRADQPLENRVPFTLIVDEFQNFASDDFETILSESRKYRLRLVFAHQYLHQLDQNLQRAVFANVGTQIIFAVSAQDAAVIARQLPGDTLTVHQLVQQPVGQATLLRRREPPTPIQILPVLEPSIPEPELQAFSVELRRGHGRAVAAVQAEMKARVQHPANGGSPSGVLHRGVASKGPALSRRIKEAQDD